MEDNAIHNPNITDEEVFQELKTNYRKSPKTVKNPLEWKKQRLVQLKREGKNWSRNFVKEQQKETEEKHG